MGVNMGAYGSDPGTRVQGVLIDDRGVLGHDWKAGVLDMLELVGACVHQ